jgi:hypothetical protein
MSSSNTQNQGHPNFAQAIPHRHANEQLNHRGTPRARPIPREKSSRRASYDPYWSSIQRR